MSSVGSVKSSFFVRKTIDHAAAFTVEHYPLKNSAILDSGTTIHKSVDSITFEQLTPVISSGQVNIGSPFKDMAMST